MMKWCFASKVLHLLLDFSVLKENSGANWRTIRNMICFPICKTIRKCLVKPNRESGEKPERSGHCKREWGDCSNHCPIRVRRESSSLKDRESGDLLSDLGELPKKADRINASVTNPRKIRMLLSLKWKCTLYLYEKVCLFCTESRLYFYPIKVKHS